MLHLDSYAEQSSDLVTDPLAGTRLTSNLEDGPYGRRTAAGLRVDPSPGPARTVSSPGHTVVAGLEFAPLRAGVVARRGSWTPVEDGPSRVLVMMGGGGDPAGLVDRTLAALAGAHVAEVTVVSPRDLAVPQGLQVNALSAADDVAGLMAEHDLLVTAAGTSVWEACCVGMPMAVVRAAENQARAYAWVTDHDAAEGLGTDPGAAPARSRLEALLRDPSRRAAMAARAGALVDGHGAWRVVRIWEQLLSVTGHASSPTRAVTVRAATDDDAGLLRSWRNDPATRSSSRSSHPVSEEEHRSWLSASLRRTDRLLLVGEEAASSVGSVRWDEAGEDAWEVSIMVAPARRGRGLAEPMLRAAEAELVVRRPEVRALLAVVHESNTASRRLFTRAGYLAYQPPDPAGFACYRRVLS